MFTARKGREHFVLIADTVVVFGLGNGMPRSTRAKHFEDVFQRHLPE